MERKITKTQLITYIKRLDTRCKKFDDEKFDEIIDDAFSEFNTTGAFFFNEDALEVTDYITDGVIKLSYDIEKDVTYVYDAFLSTDSKTPMNTSDRMVEVDPRVTGRINLDFSSTEDMYNAYTYHYQEDFNDGSVPEVLVVRYNYVPTSDFDEIYMNRDVYKAFRQAISTSAYMDLHDEKKAAMHHGKMIRDAKAITIVRPHDFDDEPLLRKFPNGC